MSCTDTNNNCNDCIQETGCKETSCECSIYIGNTLPITGIIQGDNDCVSKEKIEKALEKIILKIPVITGELDCSKLTE